MTDSKPQKIRILYIALDDNRVLLELSELNPNMPYVSYDTRIFEALK